MASETTNLVLRSPISGMVTTPRVSDRLGTYLTEGTEVAEIADMQTMRARIYISEYDMHKYRPGSTGRLHVDGILGKWDAGKLQVLPATSEVAPGLVDLREFQGMRPPKFYEVDLRVSNPGGRLRPGMVGTARVYGDRHSLAGFAVREVADFFRRKVW